MVNKNVTEMKKYITKINIICALCILLFQNSYAQSVKIDTISLHIGDVVNGKTLNQSIETNPANALFGQISGLYVMQSNDGTNVLDNQASFNIRGISTFGNSAPLVLVDGVERDIATLSISEIANVRVLKDAVSSALYGVSGANGVILITTKRGHKGFNATANYKFSINTPFRLPKMADAATYGNMVNEAMVLDGLTPFKYSTKELGYLKDGTNRELYPNVDWIDQAYRAYGETHQADVQFEGGGDKFTFYTAMSYGNTIGLLNATDLYPQYNSQLRKVFLNLKANMDAQLTKTTHLKVNLLAKLTEQNRPGTGMQTIINELYDTPSAAFPVQTGLGKWGGSNIYTHNPIADIADRGTVEVNRRTLLADMTLNQKLDVITPGLYAELNVAYDNMANYNDSRTRNYEYSYVMPVLDENGDIDGCYRKTLGTQTELGWGSTLNTQYMHTNIIGKIGYDKVFGKHYLKSAILYQQNTHDINGRNTQRNRQSLIASVNYNYNNKYYLDGVLNYSGTSSLPEDEHFNFLPAIGAGWIVSNEDFFSSNVIDYLKVNTSYGISGSDLFAHDLETQYYGIGGGQYFFTDNNTAFSGIKEGNLAVQDLKLEKSEKFDIGFDIKLLKKIALSATYFYEDRTNILVSGSPVISSVIGIGVSNLSTGEVKNHGVELAARINDKLGKFSYDISGNFTYAKNEIINNNEGYKPFDYLYRKGNSLNQYYGLLSDGFYNSQDEIDNASVTQSFGTLRPGDVKYVDQNDDNVINEDDVVRLGYSSLPEIYYGVNVNLEYSGFSLAAQFQGVANRDIYLNASSLYWPLKNNTNISEWYLKDHVRWTPETVKTADLPRLTTEANANNFRKSDIWKVNGNFFKLRNLQIAYEFKEKLINKLKVKVYLTGSNLFSVDNLDYADPENYGRAYPTLRSYTAGVKINF